MHELLRGIPGLADSDSASAFQERVALVRQGRQILGSSRRGGHAMSSVENKLAATLMK